MSAERQKISWLSSTLMDESIPPTRPAPDDWIKTLGDDAPFLDDGEEPGSTDLKPLYDGDVVAFSRCTHLGRAALTIEEDGQWNVSTPMPEEATHVCPTYTMALGRDVHECVECLIEDGFAPDEFEISYYAWSDPIPHRFDAQKRSFAECR